MSSYKESDDCFVQKSKTIFSYEVSTVKSSKPNLTKLQNLFDQFHNSIISSNFSPAEIANIFHEIDNIITNSHENQLTNFFANASQYICDFIGFYQIVKESSHAYLFDTYFSVLLSISLKSHVLSHPSFYEFFLMLVQIFDTLDIKNCPKVRNTIINIIVDYHDPALLLAYLNTPAFHKLFDLCVTPQPSASIDTKQIQTACLIATKRTLFNLKQVVNLKDEPIYTQIVNFFMSLFQIPNIDSDMNQLYVFMELSSIIFSEIPELVETIIECNIYEVVFRMIQIDNRYAYDAFKYLTQILQCCKLHMVPDFDNCLNFSELLKFFSVSKSDEPKLRSMLLFSSKYISFGTAFIHKFIENNFFEMLYSEFIMGGMTFETSIVALDCLINAVIFGSLHQIDFFFEKGALQIFVHFLEMDSNEEQTERILNGIKRIWESCNEYGKADIFSEIFVNESGYDILMSLETCPNLAQELSDLLS
ncbi:hypothetical protein TRFO_37676 [Tritrichomonas foetus]|uniref:Uncharacterized protein n=1 Tax=Tritrichomonas foetus TaxID=1144522 RepID=A0A1J4JAH2_9EUKA|nr:hypothetical protein TRFO_37676 [Tritrichomonas foetus]|eukprot:OHS96144.1 hypothetical protein TRFO_37676 [Tritrichomonas foetus]